MHSLLFQLKFIQFVKFNTKSAYRVTNDKQLYKNEDNHQTGFNRQLEKNLYFLPK